MGGSTVVTWIEHPSSPPPTEIGNCVNLVFLEVQHNNLTALPESVGNLKALRRLGLRYNNLTSLPASTCECVLLEEISLDNNQLSTLPVRGRGFLCGNDNNLIS